jgi:hypothetical protein
MERMGRTILWIIRLARCMAAIKAAIKAAIMAAIMACFPPVLVSETSDRADYLQPVGGGTRYFFPSSQNRFYWKAKHGLGKSCFLKRVLRV